MRAKIIEEAPMVEPLTWRDKVLNILRKMLSVGTVLSILGGGVSLVFSALSYFHHGAKQAAYGVSEVAKSVGQVAKKAGPYLVPVLAATGAAVGATATTLSFVSDNITWLVPLSIVLFAIWVAYKTKKG